MSESAVTSDKSPGVPSEPVCSEDDIPRGRIGLDRLPFVGRLFRDFDADVARTTIIQASKNAVDTLSDASRIVFSADMPEETRPVLATGPVLVVSNHPKRFDPLYLLAALEDRSDVRILARSAFGTIGANVSKYLFPIFHRSRSLSGSSHPVVKYNLARVVEPSLDDETKKQLNAAATKNASAYLDQNGAVVIFPGAHYLASGWQPGVGKIVHGCEPCRDYPVVFACISGTLALDPFFRKIPGIRKLGPRVTVTFSKPFPVTTFIKDDPVETTREMERVYSEWVRFKGLEERKMG